VIPIRPTLKLHDWHRPADIYILVKRNHAFAWSHLLCFAYCLFSATLSVA